MRNQTFKITVLKMINQIVKWNKRN